MSNEYYTPTGKPIQGSDLVSEEVRDEFLLLQALGDKLPVMASNGNAFLQVNAGASALAASAVLDAQAAGIKVIDPATSVPVIDLYDAATNVARLLHSANHLYLSNLVDSGLVYLQGKNSGSATRVLFSGDPNGQVYLYYAGARALGSASDGIFIYSATNDNPTAHFYQDDLTTRNGYIQFATTGVTITNEVHGAPITLRSENFSSGTLTNLLVGDPDAGVDLYYAGALVTGTQASGLRVGVASTNVSPSTTPTGQLIISSSGYSGYIAADGTAMYIGHNSGSRELHLQVQASTNITLGGSAASPRLGFYGATAVVKPTVTGSKGANAALTSLLTALANLGLITDGSS